MMRFHLRLGWIVGLIILVLFLFLTFQQQVIVPDWVPGPTNSANDKTPTAKIPSNNTPPAKENIKPATRAATRTQTDGLGRLSQRAQQTLILKLVPETTIDAQGLLASYRSNPAVHTQTLGHLGMLLLTFPPGWDVNAIKTELEKDPAVQYVSRNAIVRGQGMTLPNDPGFERLRLEQVDALGAWNYATDSTDIVIAVMDTGIDYTHPELKNNLWINQQELNGIPGMDDDHPDGPTACNIPDTYCDDIYGWNGINHSSNTRDDEFGVGHGTAVTGIIAAQGNNGTQVTGIVWRARVMAIKVLGSNNRGSLWRNTKQA